ncbi:VOC family protein [Streptomyces sp. NBC_01498]|uniref:VOC family protein n=1 Tax=Streptomyces sp. NBC_01498 TaxID=2975870 RepID=UPI002E7C410A|nr:VOC family protein [Streptomyces sp. NBC_01498]WTL25341.1 VOC family protein [Streptomyces sp. NBC_01498]
MTPAGRRGLPGLAGVEHIGFTVPDLKAATAFFTEVIGCEPVYTLGPFRSDGTWMADHLNVHPRAVVHGLAFFRCANGPNFEVFQYESPDQHPVPPRNSDIGGHHLAFYVQDLDAAVAHLRAHRVTVLGKPTDSTGPSEGQRWVYFLTPWGMQLELVSFPRGKAYERALGQPDGRGGRGVRLWQPEVPDEPPR